MNRVIISIFVAFAFFVPFTISCRAQPKEVALSVLRKATRNGKLPAESLAAGVEARYRGTEIGAAARILRARIRFENGDSAGAAALLDSGIFEDKNQLADHALWLRGRALAAANRNAEAGRVFEKLIVDHPDSIRIRDARILWVESIGLTSLQKVVSILEPLLAVNDPEALSLLAKAHETAGDSENAREKYRQIYYYGAGSDAGTAAEAWLKTYRIEPRPKTSDELLARADRFFEHASFNEAAQEYEIFGHRYLNKYDTNVKIKHLTAAARSRQSAQMRQIFDRIPRGADEKQEAYYLLALGYAEMRLWNDARRTVDEMRRMFPRSEWTPKTLVALGMFARTRKRNSDESYFLRTAVDFFPNSIAVTTPHFESAWKMHESGNYALSSRMLTEHLARYVDKDNSHRGQAGYWAARDSERADNIDEACALYDGVAFRYGSNWYGYLALKRITSLRRNGKCQNPNNFARDSIITKAVANLKVVIVAPETASDKDHKHAAKGQLLSEIGLFDWALEEIQEAKESTGKSPSMNLALAKHYRLKGDNVRALLSLAKSYPDYAQMFPEEMGHEEWDIFYPLVHWSDIKYWAKRRNLDPYQVAGLIRQETIFDTEAKSSANAYGLMQLLVPTARATARKYGSVEASRITSSALLTPSLNIELGTAYMRDQLTNYGRIEYMSVAYNAGPARIIRWRRQLPLEIDEFVEAIPFRETRGYVKGIIRNSAQYRRLYDLDGKFKANVGLRPLRGKIASKSL